jgi:hypothetical protein
LGHFPEPEHNPRRIDLFPFAFLPVIGDQDGMLIYCRRLEVVVALVYDGMIRDYRLLPGTSELSEEEIFDFIATQIGQLENSIGHEGFPLWVIGAGVTEELMVILYKTDRTILTPAEDVFGFEIGFDMAPAALLALAEMRAVKKVGQIDFRQGDFAARGQLEIFRTKLIAVVIILLLVIVGVGVTMELGYLQRSREEKQLKKEMVTIFQQVMSPGAPIVDVPLQLESELKELQKQVQFFGVSGHGAATVLQRLSASIDPSLHVDFRELYYSPEEVRIAATADSFESVDKIVEQLKENPIFDYIEITNAKLATDNSQVDFELKLKFSGEDGQ